MLEVINRLLHGYVALPVIHACDQSGLFELLSQDTPISFDKINDQLGANSGHLKASLRLLESLGWLDRTERGTYLLTALANRRENIHPNVVELYQQPLQDLSAWLSSALWNAFTESLVPQDPLASNETQDNWNDYLHGPYLVPLLVLLQQQGTFEDLSGPLFAALSEQDRAAIQKVFAYKGWCLIHNNQCLVTEQGRYLFERVQLMTTVYSYRSMLSQLPELLCGDCAQVFKRNACSDEQHVDRSLNVMGSGFSHQKYFTDLEHSVCEIFDHTDWQRQPKVIADTGCGDGSLLQRLYDAIRDTTQRGQHLDEHPLTLIAIDYNQAALDVTAQTLASYPHRVLQGDMGDPESILQDIIKLGFTKDDVLHVRSFLDHDRPYLAPQNNTAPAFQLDNDDAVYVNADGSTISSQDMLQSTVEHFARWKKIIGRHGLITLEVHSLPAKVVYNNLDVAENVHFDAVHAFSSQYLLPAEQYVQAAAAAGLWAQAPLSRRYPQTLNYSRISLHQFKPSSILLRQARADDIESLKQLEKSCWQAGTRSTQRQLQKRLQQYPQGQWVVQKDDQVIGVLYTQPIDDPSELQQAEFKKVESLFSPQGQYLQLIALNIHPQSQQQGLGDLLRQQVLLQAKLQCRCNAVLGITRLCGITPLIRALMLNTWHSKTSKVCLTIVCSHSM